MEAFYISDMPLQPDEYLQMEHHMDNYMDNHMDNRMDHTRHTAFNRIPVGSPLSPYTSPHPTSLFSSEGKHEHEAYMVEWGLDESIPPQGSFSFDQNFSSAKTAKGTCMSV